MYSKSNNNKQLQNNNNNTQQIINDTNNTKNPTDSIQKTKTQETSKETISLLPKLKNKYSSLTIDNVIAESGYNLIILQIYILTGIKNFLYGYYFSCLIFLIKPVKSFFKLSDFNSHLIFCLGYLGLILSSFLTGYLTDNFSRINLIYICLLNIFLFHLMMSFIKNIIIFSVCLLVIYFFVTLLGIIQTNIMVEYLPNKNRFFVFNSNFIFFPLGSIFFLVMYQNYVRPPLDYLATNPYNFFLALDKLYLPLILFIIVFILFMKDSPRNLILKDQLEEAQRIINELGKKNYSYLEIKIIQNNSKKNSENKFYKKEKGIFEIFNPRIIKFSFQLFITYFAFSFVFIGFLNVYPIISLEILKKNKLIEINNYDKINKLHLISSNIASIIVIFLLSILTQLNFLSRKNWKLVIFTLTILTAFAAIVFSDYFYIFICISNNLCGFIFNILILYTLEKYPTVLKDYALGVYMFIFGLGGLLSQYFFIFLKKIGKFFPVVVYIIILLSLVVLFYFLPNDNEENIDAYIIDNEKNENDLNSRYDKKIENIL